MRARLFATTMLGGVAALCASSFIAPGTAQAQCAGVTVNSGGTTVVGPGVVVDCTGGAVSTSFSGAARRNPASSATPINGFTLQLQNGTTLTGPAGEPSGFPTPTTALVGDGSIVIIDATSRLEAPTTSGAATGAPSPAQGITVGGDNVTIDNSGSIVAVGNAVRSNTLEATGSPGANSGLTVTNSGLIVTNNQSGGGDTITLGRNGTLTNSGTIRRATTSGPQPTTNVPRTFNAVNAIGGTVTNSGTIDLTVTANNQRASSAVAFSSGTSLVNTGEIKATVLTPGVSSAVSGMNAASIANEPGGTIDGRGASSAIRLTGANQTIFNSGRILGGREDAISIRGEGFRLFQGENAVLQGDVDVSAAVVRPATIAEVGFNPRDPANPTLDPNNPADVARFNQICANPSANPSICQVFGNGRPQMATVQFVTDRNITIDPNATSFRGINNFVVTGSGDVTILQNFAGANAVGMTGGPVGDFNQTLTLNPANNGGTLILTGVISDPADGRTPSRLVKDGAGTAILTGNNTYTGGTTINGGVLAIGNGGTRGSIVGNVVNNGALQFQRSDATTFGGVISGTGQVLATNAGTVTFTGTNTYTGGTVIGGNAGLIVGDGGTNGSIVGDVRNAGSLIFNRSDNVRFGGAISGGGQLAQLGRGRLTLTGANTYTGPTEIFAGELSLLGSLTSPVNVRNGARFSGTGTTTGTANVFAGGRIAPGNPTGGLTVGGLNLRAGSVLEINAEEGPGQVLTADTLTVNGRATFGATGPGRAGPFGPTILDVIFEANAPIPDLQGITIVSATGGVGGRAPTAILDPASLPNGQNFTLDVEATNLGGTFANGGELIPAGAGGQGFVVLQIENTDPNFVTPPQVTVINAPYLVPTAQPILAPNVTPILVPPAVPGATPTLQPVLIKGPTSNVATPVTPTQPGQPTPSTGIRVRNGGVVLGNGTLTPTPLTPGGTPVPPTEIPVGTQNPVVVVDRFPTTPAEVPTITGSYGQIDQRNARPGTAYRLIYEPDRVLVAKTPQNYGALEVLGVPQTGRQRTQGRALTELLPGPAERATDPLQALLIEQLYPLSIDEIPNAIAKVAGEGTDPTFEAVMHNRDFRSSIVDHLADLRDGRSAYGLQRCGDTVIEPLGDAGVPTDPTPEGRCRGSFWAHGVGEIGSGDFLNDSEFHRAGFVAGLDGNFGDNFTAGGAISVVGTHFEPDFGGSADVTTFDLAAYASWTENVWFATGMAGVGQHWIDIDRHVLTGTDLRAEGSVDAVSAFVAAQAGGRLGTELVTFEPSVGISYDYLDRDGFTETGAGILNRTVGGETLDSAQVSVGVRAFTDIALDNGMLLSPEVRVAYAREIGDTDVSTRSSFAGAPNAVFTVLTEGPGEDVGLFGAGLTATQDQASFFVDYQAELREDLLGHTIRGGFSLQF